MKNVLLFLTFIAVLLSCSKDDEEVSSIIDGRWEWVKTTGGYTGVILTPDSTGEQIIVEFSKGNYKKYVNGKLNEEISFRVEATSLNNEDIDVVIYENEYESKQYIRMNGNELILDDEGDDGSRFEYIKE